MGTMDPRELDDQRSTAAVSPPDLVTDHVVARIQATLASRRAGGAVAAPPQALVGFDADEVEALEFYPWRKVLGSPGPVRLHDLLEAPPDAFVGRCYKLLLLRDPDPKEAQEVRDQLARGFTRLLVIARLRWSAEGRKVGIGVPGLASRVPPSFALSVARAMVAAFGKGP